MSMPGFVAAVRSCAGCLLAWCCLLGVVPGLAAAADANAASHSQLQQVKGIGAKTAAAIVQERQRGGPFTSFQDLSERVPTIGVRRVQRLRRAGLTVGASALPSAGKASNIIINTPPAGRAKHH